MSSLNLWLFTRFFNQNTTDLRCINKRIGWLCRIIPRLLSLLQTLRWLELPGWGRDRQVKLSFLCFVFKWMLWNVIGHELKFCQIEQDLLQYFQASQFCTELETTRKYGNAIWWWSGWWRPRFETLCIQCFGHRFVKSMQFVKRFRHQPFRLTFFCSGIFVLCLENSGQCHSDDNNLVFNVVDSILVSPDCVNTIWRNLLNRKQVHQSWVQN